MPPIVTPATLKTPLLQLAPCTTHPTALPKPTQSATPRPHCLLSPPARSLRLSRNHPTASTSQTRHRHKPKMLYHRHLDPHPRPSLSAPPRLRSLPAMTQMPGIATKMTITSAAETKTLPLFPTEAHSSCTTPDRPQDPPAAPSAPLQGVVEDELPAVALPATATAASSTLSASLEPVDRPIGASC